MIIKGNGLMRAFSGRALAYWAPEPSERQKNKKNRK
jgi:hypothetical protein